MTSNASETKARRSKIAKTMAWLCFIAAVALIGGFFPYLNTIHPPISERPAIEKADGIIVLTGGVARLAAAAKLLSDGKAKRLLVSGVNESASEASLIEALKVDRSLFDCCIDIDRLALDTVGNAQEGTKWAIQNDFASLIIVTNDYHMPRSMLEFRRADQDFQYQGYMVSNLPQPNESMNIKVDRYRVLIGEYTKLLLAYIRSIIS